MITYEQYEAKEFTHAQYYSEFVNDAVMDIVVAYIGVSAIKMSIEERFNDIPLQKWDNCAGSILSMCDDLLTKKGSQKTLSIAICIAKSAARRIRGI